LAKGGEIAQYIRMMSHGESILNDECVARRILFLFFFATSFAKEGSLQFECGNIPGVQRRTERGFSCTDVPSFDFSWGNRRRHKTKIDFAKHPINTHKNTGSEKMEAPIKIPRLPVQGA
jgi:hypothetical protein